MIGSLREIAHVLGGECSAGQVLAPGPGHSRRDRSLTVRLSPGAPDGFLAFSHSGDDWRVCRDYVRERLGLNGDNWKDRERQPTTTPKIRDGGDDAQRVLDALACWNLSVDPRRTLADRYLASRGLEIGDLAEDVLRWNARIGAMIALFRNITTGEPQAVARTYLDADARKIERKFLGPVAGAAIMLDDFGNVTHGLHVGEGLETCQAARQLGLRPTWALGSAGAVAAFPVLGGVECLTLLAEHDDASARAVEACARRWHAAGREVLINRPVGGKDLNDAIRGDAA